MVIVAASLWVDADDRDAMVSAFAGFVKRIRQAPGCLDLSVSADPTEPGWINNSERWDSLKAFTPQQVTPIAVPATPGVGTATPVSQATPDDHRGLPRCASMLLSKHRLASRTRGIITGLITVNIAPKIVQQPDSKDDKGSLAGRITKGAAKKAVKTTGKALFGSSK